MRKMKVFCRKCGREAEILGYIIENVSVIDMESIKVEAGVPSWAYLAGVHCPRCKITCEFLPFDGGLVVDLIDGKRFKLVGEELWKQMIKANIDGDLEENFELREVSHGTS